MFFLTHSTLAEIVGDFLLHILLRLGGLANLQSGWTINVEGGIQGRMSHSDTKKILEALRSRFELENAVVIPLQDEEGHVFQVRQGAEKYCLKLVPEATVSEVGSQLEFMAHLRAGGLPVVEVIDSIDEILFHDARQSIGILSRWVEGETLEARTDSETIYEVGTLLARLHMRSREFTPPSDFQRQRWEMVYAPREGEWLEEFFAERPLDARSRRIIENGVRKSRSAVHQLGDDPKIYHMIHADFHGGNLLHDGEALHIIDFEDCGWGHCLLDIVWPATLFAKRHDGPHAFLDPFLAGYERVRPLESLERALLPDFLIGALIGVIEMVYRSSVDQDGPIAKEWYEFAVRSLDLFTGNA